MADKLMQTVLTLAVLEAEKHYYGRRRAIGRRKMGHATLLGADALENADSLKAGWLV